MSKEIIMPEKNVDKEIKPKVEIPKFPMPKPNPNCKKCYGTGRLGFVYDSKNIEYDENGDRKRGKPIPCPNYTMIVQRATKEFFDSLTSEQQYDITRKDGDPETLAEAKAIQDTHDRKIDEKDAVTSEEIPGETSPAE